MIFGPMSTKDTAHRFDIMKNNPELHIGDIIQLPIFRVLWECQIIDIIKDYHMIDVLPIKKINKGEIKQMDYVSNIRKVLAIEMLEYEDKNYLSGDNKTRSEEKQKLLKEVLGYLEQKTCTTNDNN